MFRFSRRIQLDKFLGTAYRYESAEFTAEAETKKQAEGEVWGWMQEYLEGMKKKIETEKVNKEPFTGKEFSSKK